MISSISNHPAHTHPAAKSVPSTPPHRNSFLELFGGLTQAASQKSVAKTEVASSMPAPAVPNSLSNVQPQQTTPSNAAANAPATHNPPAAPVLDSSWTPSSTQLALDPLKQAMQHAGLDPGKFQFNQVEAQTIFPTRPDLNYTTHQIAISGPNGSGLFDRDLALRTPWVTAVELKTYGIA